MKEGNFITRIMAIFITAALLIGVVLCFAGCGGSTTSQTTEPTDYIEPTTFSAAETFSLSNMCGITEFVLVKSVVTDCERPYIVCFYDEIGKYTFFPDYLKCETIDMSKDFPFEEPTYTDIESYVVKGPNTLAFEDGYTWVNYDKEIIDASKNQFILTIDGFLFDRDYGDDEAILIPFEAVDWDSVSVEKVETWDIEWGVKSTWLTDEYRFYLK